MRYTFLTVLLVFSFIFPAIANIVEASTIPSSNKSQNVYRRVAPKLNSEMHKIGATLGDPIFIRLFKKEKKLEIWVRQGLTYVMFKSYSVCYNSGVLGPKLREGDKQSPEGFYTVAADQLNPNSDYHLSFNLGYPNEYDRSHKRTGSLLMIHGRCSSAGCFAMADFRMDEIYALVESAIISGQHQVPIHIFPFKMTTSNMAAHRDSKWIEFWKNLKEGYDYFEGHHAPPLVIVQDKRYKFITFRPLLFGGNLPDVSPEFRYAGLKKKREQKLLAEKREAKRKARLLAEQKRTETALAEAKSKQKRQKRTLYVATRGSKSSLQDPLGLGD